MSLGLLILFIDSSNASLSRKLIGALVSEFGFAFFIAFVLHVTVELHAKIEHDRQLSRGILSYVYGNNLDNEIFFATEEHIFRSGFYRRNLELEYDFLHQKDGKFLIKYTIGYIVENIGRKPDHYEIRTFVEKPSESSTASEWPHSLGLYRMKIGDHVLSDNELAEARTQGDEDDPNYFQILYKILLQPGEKRRVQNVLFVEKCERDGELWRSVHPCADLTLTVRWRPEFAIKLRADPVHPSGKFDSAPYEAAGLFQASVLKPFFPHNGVHFWWGAS